MHFRYVILHHTGVPEPHYDLMFEVATDGPLRTFRSVAWPVVEATELTPLADHRRAYLEYEGPVSGDRGQVERVEGGVCTIDPPWDVPGPPQRHHLTLGASRFILTRGARWRIQPA